MRNYDGIARVSWNLSGLKRIVPVSLARGLIVSRFRLAAGTFAISPANRYLTLGYTENVHQHELDPCLIEQVDVSV